MRRVGPLALLIASAGCGGTKPALATNVGVAALGSATPLPSAAVPSTHPEAPPGLDAHPLFSVPDGSIGPFMTRRREVVMGAYIGTSSEGARRVVSVPLTGGCALRGDSRVVAPIATDATMLVLRPTGGPKPGFVAAWTSLTDRGEALSVVGIMDDGRPQGEPTELARTADDVVWVEIVPTPRGALVLWAEQTSGGDANLVAAALGPDGALRGLPARIVRGVTGWQAVPTGDGASLALVAPLPAKKGSVITWQRFDADARATGAAVTVASGAHISGDVDAARAGDQVLLAWTDAASPDAQPVVVTIDPAGKPHGPTRAIPGGAGGALVGLTGGPAGAVLAWEEPFRRGRSSKRINLARLDLTTRMIDPRAEAPLELQGRGAPEIVALDEGFALLAPARVCVRGDACEDAPTLPTFVRFDAKLGVSQVEPLRLGVLREPVAAGWGLACGVGAECLALAVAPLADGGAPGVAGVDLRPRATSYRPPVVPPPPAGAPLIESLDTVAAGEPFADLASARLGDGVIFAAVASANDETAKRDDTARISARTFDAAGAPAGDALVTKRALPSGGVAIATTGRPEDGAAIAWVGRDGNDPQVHVSRVDRRGHLIRDVQLTNVKGDASDVAVAWSGEQWIVAWVDTRDGNGEVYAATLSRDGRAGRGQRITNAAGDASDVALLAVPDGVGPDGRGAVWLAWADPRESPQEGFADIYVAPLRASDASRAGDEVRVLATAAHSRSPALAGRGKDIALGWIEEAPMGADPAHARAYGAMLAWLGSTGHPVTEPTRLPVAGDGFPTAIALDGSRPVFTALLARAAPDMMVLDALELAREREGEGTPYPLITLDGPATLDVALGLTGDVLFFNDESADASARRIRRATVHWRR